MGGSPPEGDGWGAPKQARIRRGGTSGVHFLHKADCWRAGRSSEERRSSHRRAAPALAGARPRAPRPPPLALPQPGQLPGGTCAAAGGCGCGSAARSPPPASLAAAWRRRRRRPAARTASCCRRCCLGELPGMLGAGTGRPTRPWLPWLEAAPDLQAARTTTTLGDSLGSGKVRESGQCGWRRASGSEYSSSPTQAPPRKSLDPFPDRRPIAPAVRPSSLPPLSSRQIAMQAAVAFKPVAARPQLQRGEWQRPGPPLNPCLVARQRPETGAGAPIGAPAIGSRPCVVACRLVSARHAPPGPLPAAGSPCRAPACPRALPLQPRRPAARWW